MFMKSEVKHVELQVSLFFLFLISLSYFCNNYYFLFSLFSFSYFFFNIFVFFSNNYYAMSDEYI